MNSTVRGVLQARILEWVAFLFSRGSSQPGDRTQVSHIAARFFTSWATGKTLFPGTECQIRRVLLKTPMHRQLCKEAPVYLHHAGMSLKTGHRQSLCPLPQHLTVGSPQRLSSASCSIVTLPSPWPLMKKPPEESPLHPPPGITVDSTFWASLHTQGRPPLKDHPRLPVAKGQGPNSSLALKTLCLVAQTGSPHSPPAPAKTIHELWPFLLLTPSLNLKILFLLLFPYPNLSLPSKSSKFMPNLLSEPF